MYGDELGLYVLMCATFGYAKMSVMFLNILKFYAVHKFDKFKQYK